MERYVINEPRLGYFAGFTPERNINWAVNPRDPEIVRYRNQLEASMALRIVKVAYPDAAIQSFSE